jgi:IS605 OrfB family transposase
MVSNKDAGKQPVLTLRLRVKDKHARFLCGQAREVNFVWNFCNETSVKILEREQRFCSNVDLDKLTSGVTIGDDGLSLHSQTVQAVSKEYVTRRKQFKKVKLRWRKSHGARRSLGWIPFKASAISYKNGQVKYCGKFISLWDSYVLSRYELGTGSFSEDSRGRWYLNVTATPKDPSMFDPSQGSRYTPAPWLWPKSPAPKAVKPSTGIDLNLKEFLATSDGQVVEAEKLYRKYEIMIAAAQRANKKARVKALHAEVANRRKDFHHKLSTELVNTYGAIFVGNVNSSGLAKTRMAKSVLDAGWRQFRTMLQYKCDYAGVWFEEVNEAYSTQTCSCCQSRTGPKGVAGLGIREWACSECGAYHHRDINAASNILATGLRAVVESGQLTAGLIEAAMRSSAPTTAPGHGRLAGGIPVL